VLVHGKRRGIVNRALGGVVGQLVATVGGTVVREAVDFFKSFEGIEEGFRTRGDLIYDTLRSDDTSFIVVASPTGASLKNASDFTTQLREAEVTPALTIANRCTPEVPKAGRSKIASTIVDHLRTKRTAERENIAAYAQSSELPLVLVDDLPEPVTNITGIKTLAKSLCFLPDGVRHVGVRTNPSAPQNQRLASQVQTNGSKCTLAPFPQKGSGPFWANGVRPQRAPDPMSRGAIRKPVEDFVERGADVARERSDSPRETAADRVLRRLEKRPSSET